MLEGKFPRAASAMERVADHVAHRLVEAGVTHVFMVTGGGAMHINDALGKASVGKFTVVSTEVVGPVIGKDLQLKGIYATIASLVGILFYIWMRFEWTFAVGVAAGEGKGLRRAGGANGSAEDDDRGVGAEAGAAIGFQHDLVPVGARIAGVELRGPAIVAFPAGVPAERIL